MFVLTRKPGRGAAGVPGLAVPCNLVLLGATCWAAVTQYPDLEGPGVIPFVALAIVTPLLSVAALRRAVRPSPTVRDAMDRGHAAALLLLALSAAGLAAASPQTPPRPREVRRVYWELEKRTDVYLRLIPEDAAGGKSLVSLTFRAEFPGVAKRNPYDGRPEWPAGPPARVTLTAEPLPSVLIKALALSLEIDGRAANLTPPGGRHRNIPCLAHSDDCAPYGVEADIDSALLTSLLEAHAVEGLALGFAVRLTKEDQAAIREFGARARLFQR